MNETTNIYSPFQRFTKKPFTPLTQLKCPKFSSQLGELVGKGELFPALRLNKIDFYFAGRRLLRRNPQSWVSNKGYTDGTTKGNKDVAWKRDPTLSELETLMQNCRDYPSSRPEGKSICKLFPAFSAWATNPSDEGPWLVDLEISFQVAGIYEEHNRKSDKIDLVFLTSSNKLLFIEAKRRDDSRVRTELATQRPKVLGQLAGYRKQLAKRRTEISNAYKNAFAEIASFIGNRNIEEIATSPPTLLTDEVPILIVPPQSGPNGLPKDTPNGLPKDTWLEPWLANNANGHGWHNIQKKDAYIIDADGDLRKSNFGNLRSKLIQTIKFFENSRR